MKAEIDGMGSAGITRREALKKIGKYGIYVPATMAVLRAAPRAFAQSQQCDLYFEWTLTGGSGQGAPSSVTYANGQPSPPPRIPVDTTWTFRSWTLTVRSVGGSVAGCLSGNLSVFSSVMAHGTGWSCSLNCDSPVLSSPNYSYECTSGLTVTAGPYTCDVETGNIGVAFVDPGEHVDTFDQVVFICSLA